MENIQSQFIKDWVNNNKVFNYVCDITKGGKKIGEMGLTPSEFEFVKRLKADGAQHNFSFLDIMFGGPCPPTQEEMDALTPLWEKILNKFLAFALLDNGDIDDCPDDEYDFEFGDVEENNNIGEFSRDHFPFWGQDQSQCGEDKDFDIDTDHPKYGMKVLPVIVDKRDNSLSRALPDEECQIYVSISKEEYTDMLTRLCQHSYYQSYNLCCATGIIPSDIKNRIDYTVAQYMISGKITDPYAIVLQELEDDKTKLLSDGDLERTYRRRPSEDILFENQIRISGLSLSFEQYVGTLQDSSLIIYKDINAYQLRVIFGVSTNAELLERFIAMGNEKGFLDIKSVIMWLNEHKISYTKVNG